MATSNEVLTPKQLQELLDGPAVAPPASIIPNLAHPPNIDTVCYMTFSLCVSFVSLAVIIRMYTKRVLIRSIAYEDCEYLKSVSAVPTILTLYRRLYGWICKNTTSPRTFQSGF